MSQQINLYSPIFRKQKKVFSAVTMLQGLALIAVVAGALYFYIALQTAVLVIRADQSAQQLKGELERLKAYGVREAPADRAKALAERKKALEGALASHSKALEALDSGAVGRVEGYSATLAALARLSMEGVWLTRIQLSEREGGMSLSGRATHAELVPAYLERLRSEEVLRDQPFSRLEVTRAAPEPPKPGDPAPGAFVEFALSGEAGAKK